MRIEHEDNELEDTLVKQATSLSNRIKFPQLYVKNEFHL